MKRERQMERDRRHEQRMKHGLENEEVEHRYIISNGGNRRRGSGGSAASATSEGSEGSNVGVSPQVPRSKITISSSRHQSSDDEQGFHSNGYQQKLRSSFKHGSNEPNRSATSKGINAF